MPVGQLAQVNESDAPVLTDELPTEQLAQLTEPTVLWYWPAPQLIQVEETDAPALNE
jgi:hypothetical protein